MATRNSARPGAPTRAAIALLAAAFVTTALAACAPEPESGAPASPSATRSASSSATPTASPTATADPTAAIELPADCEDIYSDAFLASLGDMTLNDPGVTLLSTEMTAALEVIETSPTIRCSWGGPSEYGLATNVTIVDGAQADALEQSMRETGMTCAEVAEGTLCRIETEHLLEDDTISKTGETHFLRENGWVSTHWINFAPEGYTEDIVATLWG